MGALPSWSIPTIPRPSSLLPETPWTPSTAASGVKRLKDCIRVLDGFGRSLEVILPKLREGFVTPDAESAKSLALENPNAFFLAPSGECFHNVTVTGGKPSVEGPLALKGELRETQKRLDLVEAELARAEITAASLARLLSELAAQSERISEERRNAERESANQSAALRQMDAEVARLERRLDDWVVQSERNKDLRNVRQALIEEKREEVARLEAEHAAARNQGQRTAAKHGGVAPPAGTGAATGGEKSPPCWRDWKSAAAARKPPSPASIACTATWNGGSINWSSSWPRRPRKNNSARARTNNWRWSASA